MANFSSDKLWAYVTSTKIGNNKLEYHVLKGIIVSYVSSWIFFLTVGMWYTGKLNVFFILIGPFRDNDSLTHLSNGETLPLYRITSFFLGIISLIATICFICGQTRCCRSFWGILCCHFFCYDHSRSDLKLEPLWKKVTIGVLFSIFGLVLLLTFCILVAVSGVKSSQGWVRTGQSNCISWLGFCFMASTFHTMLVSNQMEVSYLRCLSKL